jgi:hypothetical protein
VQQDVWQEVGSQTMWVCGISNWKAVARQTGPASSGVKAYPDSEVRDTDWSTCASQTPLGNLTKWTSTFAHSTPAAGSWDAAYDIWLNGPACGKPLIEVMIWSQYRGISVPAAQKHPVIAGTAYDYFRSGSYIQFRMHNQRSAGTVNILAVMGWLVSQGVVRWSDTRVTTKYGFEVLTTGGRDLPFWLTGFGVTG